MSSNEARFNFPAVTDPVELWREECAAEMPVVPFYHEV